MQVFWRTYKRTHTFLFVLVQWTCTHHSHLNLFFDEEKKGFTFSLCKLLGDTYSIFAALPVLKTSCWEVLHHITSTSTPLYFTHVTFCKIVFWCNSVYKFKGCVYVYIIITVSDLRNGFLHEYERNPEAYEEILWHISHFIDLFDIRGFSLYCFILSLLISISSNFLFPSTFHVINIIYQSSPHADENSLDGKRWPCSFL